MTPLTVLDKVVEALQAAGATEEMITAAVKAGGEFGDSPPNPGGRLGEALTLTVWARIPIQPPIRRALILIKRATWFGLFAALWHRDRFRDRIDLAQCRPARIRSHIRLCDQTRGGP